MQSHGYETESADVVAVEVPLKRNEKHSGQRMSWDCLSIELFQQSRLECPRGSKPLADGFKMYNNNIQ